MEGVVSAEKVSRIKGIVEEMNDPEEACLLVKLSLEKWNESMQPVEETYKECQLLYNLDMNAGNKNEESYQYNKPRFSTGNVITSGIAIPEGLDGYHVGHRKFIKYLQGCNALAIGLKVKDAELKLSKCGYWGMDIAESHKFNLDHEENNKLLSRDSKPKFNSEPCETEEMEI